MLLLGLFGLVLVGAAAAQGEGRGFQLDDLLGGGSAGFARALAPRPFHFPEDHGPHPDYRSEWWYFTGNLTSEAGRQFGYQLTFFRFALRPDAPVRTSAWATNQVYMAHFTLTDVDGHRFHAAERMSRDSLALAGACAEPFAVWLRDWRLESGGTAFFPLKLHAADGAVSLDLTIGGGKPWVLQGDHGLSRKGAAPGNASYYYSGTRLESTGTVTVGGEPFAVSGSSWFDREWGSSTLGADQVGWDWFSLQLDDGRDLMVYRLRRRDGSADPHSAGMLVDAEGNGTPLPTAAVALEVLDRWRSPRTGVTYPARWRIEVPETKLSLEVVPRLADQELDESVRYWEGAVKVSGPRHGEPVTGVGYVELTGYR